jgi:hypothetical protein
VIAVRPPFAFARKIIDASGQEQAYRHRAGAESPAGEYPLLGTGLVSPFKIVGDFFIEWLILKGLLKRVIQLNQTLLEVTERTLWPPGGNRSLSRRGDVNRRATWHESSTH